MAESEEELKNLLMKMKEESEKTGFKLKILKSLAHSIQSYHFMANRWGRSGNNDRLFSWATKFTVDGDCSHEIKRCLFLGRKTVTNLDSVLKSRDSFFFFFSFSISSSRLLLLQETLHFPSAQPKGQIPALATTLASLAHSAFVVEEQALALAT